MNNRDGCRRKARRQTTASTSCRTISPLHTRIWDLLGRPHLMWMHYETHRNSIAGSNLNLVEPTPSHRAQDQYSPTMQRHHIVSLQRRPGPVDGRNAALVSLVGVERQASRRPVRLQSWSLYGWPNGACRLLSSTIRRHQRNSPLTTTTASTGIHKNPRTNVKYRLPHCHMSAT